MKRCVYVIIGCVFLISTLAGQEAAGSGVVEVGGKKYVVVFPFALMPFPYEELKALGYGVDETKVERRLTLDVRGECALRGDVAWPEPNNRRGFWGVVFYFRVKPRVLEVEDRWFKGMDELMEAWGIKEGDWWLLGNEGEATTAFDLPNPPLIDEALTAGFLGGRYGVELNEEEARKAGVLVEVPPPEGLEGVRIKKYLTNGKYYDVVGYEITGVEGVTGTIGRVVVESWGIWKGFNRRRDDLSWEVIEEVGKVEPDNPSVRVFRLLDEMIRGIQWFKAYMPVRRGVLKDSRVRLRAYPSLEGAILGHLERGEEVWVLAEGPEMGGARWLAVRTMDGQEGWAYGAYIDMVR